MSTLKSTLAAALIASVLAIPATAKTRNEVLADVEAGCAANASGCAAILEAAIEEMVAAGANLGALATFTTKMVERATEAVVAAGGSVANVASVAKSAAAASGSIKEAAAAKGVFGVAKKADVAAEVRGNRGQVGTESG